MALKNGRVERLDGVEERIRSAACTLYDQIEREIFDIHWAKSLSAFTDAERDIIYTQWKQSGRFVPVVAPAPRSPCETTPYRNQYKCPDAAFDRIARSSRNSLQMIDELDGMGIELISRREGVATGDAMERLFVTIISAIAEQGAILRYVEGVRVRRKQ